MSVLGELFQDIADGIREKTGDTGKIVPANFPAAIRAIVPGGGEGHPDLRYVTFLDHDGSLLGKKAVAVGDDCADPFKRGVIAQTPTKTSDVQYDYTYAGWSTKQNGTVESGALKAVNEDRTLYAVYTGTVRSYTITYYDSDGTTVLKTESLEYGTVPASNYTPVKEGYTFTGWTPALATVRGNASYVAGWEARIGMDTYSWAEIAAISESGQAASTFMIGDKKEVTFTAPDGKTYSIFAEIIGFDHDDLADGSGKAGISMRLTRTAGVAVLGTSNAKWGECSLRTKLNTTTLESMPEDLKNSIKSVKKGYYWTTSTTGDPPFDTRYTDTCKIWLMSVGELNDGRITAGNLRTDGTPYPNIDPFAISFVDSVMYWTRSSTTNNYGIIARNDMGLFGNAKYDQNHSVVFGFCI